MKKGKLLVLAVLLAITSSIFAQGGYKAESEGWLVDLQQAYKISKETNKPIMANSTGSDWCGWCKRLKAVAFDKPEFKEWAKNNVVLLELDYPKRKKIPEEIRKQNQQLQQIFKVMGYPTVWIFTMSENESNQVQFHALGKTGYPRTTRGNEVKKFIADSEAIIAKGNQPNLN